MCYHYRLSNVQQCAIVIGNSMWVIRLYNCASVVNISIIPFPWLWQAYPFGSHSWIKKWMTQYVAWLSTIPHYMQRCIRVVISNLTKGQRSFLKLRWLTMKYFKWSNVVASHLKFASIWSKYVETCTSSQPWHWFPIKLSILWSHEGYSSIHAL